VKGGMGAKWRDGRFSKGFPAKKRQQLVRAADNGGGGEEAEERQSGRKTSNHLQLPSKAYTPSRIPLRMAAPTHKSLD